MGGSQRGRVQFGDFAGFASHYRYWHPLFPSPNPSAPQHSRLPLPLCHYSGLGVAPNFVPLECFDFLGVWWSDVSPLFPLLSFARSWSESGWGLPRPPLSRRPYRGGLWPGLVTGRRVRGWSRSSSSELCDGEGWEPRRLTFETGGLRSFPPPLGKKLP